MSRTELATRRVANSVTINVPLKYLKRMSKTKLTQVVDIN